MSKRFRTGPNGEQIERHRGRTDRPSRIDTQSVKSPDYNQGYGQSASARVEADGILRDCSEVEIDDIYSVRPALGTPSVAAYARLGLSHARQSLTKNLHLSLMPIRVDLESRPTKQLIKSVAVVNPVDRFNMEPDRMAETSDKRVTWRSDKTLLVKGKPDILEHVKFKRLTSKSKRIVTEIEVAEVLVTEEVGLESLNLFPKPKPKPAGTWADPIPSKSSSK